MLKALAREVTERYQNASDLEADLGNILFELLRADPALSLKQFMHSLFKAEIEAEHKSESEEKTISVPLEQETAVADLKSANAKKSKTPVKTRPPNLRALGFRSPQKNVYRYVISASLAAVVLVIAGFIFWDKNPPPQLTTPSPVQPVAAPQPGAEEQKTATQMPAAAPPLAGNEIEQGTPSPQTDKQQGKNTENT